MSSPVVSNDKIVLVQRYPLFCDISAPDCMAILACAHERHFLRRQVIFLAGDPIRHILLLTSGTVKVTQSGQNGGEVILRLNGVGESVGALGMCTRGEHCASVQALENCTALLWKASTFETLAERYPILQRNLRRILEIRLQEIDARFREISTEKVPSCLSSEILRLVDQIGKPTKGHVEISLSREELAQLTGTTLFTVSRLLCQWKLRGIVSTRREGVVVRNIRALIKLSEQELPVRLASPAMGRWRSISPTNRKTQRR